MPKKQATKEKKSAQGASDAGIAKRLDEREKIKPFVPSATEKKLISYINRRSNEMMEFRKGLKIEGKWKEADEEYIPHELDFGTTRKRFETDQDTGLRSRMVPVGDASQQWRQATSAPTLLAKIQVAISIIIDNQPEAELVALVKKYQATSDLAYALWKRNWSVTDAKEKLKLFTFNLIKYGWAPQRTYPRLVQYDKEVLIEKDTENPENDKYSSEKLQWFNDVDREPLDPYRTWIDEMTKPYDPYSMNECYYELDYSYDAFMTEFGMYPNSEFVPRDSYMRRDDEIAKQKSGGAVQDSSGEDVKMRKDIVTVGFFESRLKDLFGIYIPKHKITVYSSPHPNDDGMLSITHAMWLLRSSKLPYGVSLWEVIRQNKSLYDKMKNMTMDQLVLSIMKFGFFSGTSTALGDGKIEIVPGQARQLTTSSGNAKQAVDWMEIPGPGKEAWEGIKAVSAMMDDDSGISPTLEGEITGKTLGEILHAKEASLKRMKTPVENIAWQIEQDAYLTLSWMSQVYAIPTVKEFVDERAMMQYEREEQVERHELFARQDPETGETVGIQATYLPQLSLHLEDREGKLVQGKDSKFFTVGKEIKIHQMKWKGIFKVIPRSLIDKSQELVKASKMEVFNLIVPMLAQPPEIYGHAISQVLKVNEESPEDWLPDNYIEYLNGGQNEPQDKGSIFVKPPQQAQGQPPVPMGPGGQPMIPVMGGDQTMQNQAGMAPNKGAPTVVPQGQVSAPTPQQMGGAMPGGRGLFGRGL